MNDNFSKFHYKNRNDTTPKSLTILGKTALNYIAHPENFPKDCPDPRIDEKAFRDWVAEHSIYFA